MLLRVQEMVDDLINSLFQWIKEIFIIILSLAFFQIMAPESNMGKYVKFIFSFIILAVILEPLLKYI